MYFGGNLIQKVFFRETTELKSIILSLTFGTIIFPTIFILIYILVGFVESLYITPIISLIFFIVSRRIKQAKKREGTDKKLIVVILIIIALNVLTMYGGDYWRRAADPHFHFSAILSIKNTQTLPPDTACLPGENYRYSWFSHLNGAILLSYTQSSVLYTIPIFAVFTSILAILMAYLLSSRFTKSPILLTLMIISYHINVLISPGPHPAALMMVILFFYCLHNYDDKKTNKNALLLSSVSASIFYFHGFSFIFSVIILFSYCVLNILQRRFVYKHILYLALPLSLALPFYILIASTDFKLFLFVPFGGLLQRYYTLGPLLLGLVGAYFAIKKREPKMMINVSILITLFVFLNSFIMIRSLNVERFLIFMFWPLSILLIYWVERYSKAIKYSIILIVCFLLIFPYLSEILGTYEPFTQTEEYKVSSWLKQNTLLGERFVSAPTPIYLTSSERQTVFCEDGFLRGWFYPPKHIKENFEDLILLYTAPTQELVKKHNIKYFVLGLNEQLFFKEYDIEPYNFSSQTTFLEVFSGNQYKVYTPILYKLPEKLPRHDLNYTTYSRWWEL